MALIFLNKISVDWPLTLTTQLSSSELSDNPERKLQPQKSLENSDSRIGRGLGVLLKG